MHAPLLTPGRAVIAAVPVIGFFATPFLPFAIEPTLWLGIPAPLWWAAFLVILTVLSLQLIESMYLRRGGRERDAAERERLATHQIELLRAERIAAEEEEGIR